MQQSQTINPKKINLDKSSKFLDEDEAFFLLNYDVNNPSALGSGTGLPANYKACDIDLPAGENYNAGKFYSDLTNETYFWTYNSNGINFISRINGDGLCEIVWEGDNECLPLSVDPQHNIEQFRAYLKVDKLCANRHGKALVWVDGTDTPIGMLDVEASIKTNSFTTPFFDRCADPCAPLQMCVPRPSGCLVGDFVPFTSDDLGKSNNLLDKGFKFIFRNIYYDLRVSEWSDISSLYYQDAKGCFFDGEGYPRCIKFRIPVGNPMVDKIEFGFSDDGGVTWFLHDTIEKYKKYNSSQQYWYERELSEDVQSTFSDGDCSFDYYFCADKQRTSISTAQVSREFNPMPIGVQCLVNIKETLGFINYKKGNCPIDKVETDKFTIVTDCSNISRSNCVTEMAKVTVRAIIYVAGGYKFPVGYVYKTEGSQGADDDLAGTARFGFVAKAGFQQFKGSARNFISYIEGTDYWGEMEQWESSPNFTKTTKRGLYSGINNTVYPVAGTFSGDINFNYQEYVFSVPKGTKGFIRMASHNSVSGAGDNQNTSTQVLGTLGYNGLKNFNGTSHVSVDGSPKEIYFDTCDGDFDNHDAFVIADYIYTANSLVYSGYVEDKNGLPVEGAMIYKGGVYVTTTDHNGYYSLGVEDTSISIDVRVERDCFSFTTIKTTGTPPENNSSPTVISIDDDDYSNKMFFARVSMVVTDCNDKPVPRQRVAISGGKYKITDSDGTAHFKVRNYNSRDRLITAVLMDNGGCLSRDCNDACNPCLPFYENFLLPTCFDTVPTYSITFTQKLNTAASVPSNRGLKMGGRYAFGFFAEGDCGVLSAVYPLAVKGGYIDIPRLQETGVFSYCNFRYNANGIKLPTKINRLKIVRTANNNPYTIQWLVDDIDRSVNGKIKITIQSLNDYNAQYNFNTNTSYKFFKGDRVEFIQNGDGIVFPSIGGILNYSILSPFNDDVLSGVTTDVNYFNQILIEDDGKLDGLVKGAKIEIQPASVSINNPAYFEICASLDVVNGEVVIQEGIFSTFDTFLVKRQIGKFPVQFFESKTPSDFWGGDALDDTGRVHFLNKYENERRYGRNMILNSAIEYNYFGDTEKTFNAKDQGDVVAVSVKDDRIGLGISENDNFLFEVSDQLLRVGSDNIIHATTADSFISNPEAKLRGKYGCSYEDIGSILFGDGYALYADSQNDSYIIHDYRIAKPAGEVLDKKTGIASSSCNSFFRKRIRQKADVNKSATNFLDYLKYSVGINKIGIVFLTIKSLRHAGVNNEKSIYALPNDTIMYDPTSNSFLGFASFTAEGYSQLNLNNDTGCSFIAIQNSIPYIHPVLPEKYNEFFEIPCDQVIGVSLNKFQEKVKIPVAMEIQSDQMFFTSKVTTSKADFISEIPPVRVKKLNGKWNASFLNNVNSRGGLYNGDKAVDYSIQVVLVKDNTEDLKYGSIDNNKRTQFNKVDSILFKFMLAESSGQTENL